MKAKRPSETSNTTHPVTQRYITEDRNHPFLVFSDAFMHHFYRLNITLLTGSWSKWQRGLRRQFAAVCLMGLWVRIPPGGWMLSVMGVVCYQVEFSAPGWSLIQRSPTDYGVIGKPWKWGGRGPLEEGGAVAPWGGGNNLLFWPAKFSSCSLGASLWYSSKDNGFGVGPSASYF